MAFPWGEGLLKFLGAGKNGLQKILDYKLIKTNFIKNLSGIYPGGNLIMKRFPFLTLTLFLFANQLANAQGPHYFVTNTGLDTLSQYKVKLYHQSEVTTYVPTKNNVVFVNMKKIKRSDSIVLYFDAWYKEKIPKNEFEEAIIHIDKQLYLAEVVIKRETKTIGTFNKNLRSMGSRNSRGDLVAFRLNQPSKIESFKILIHKNKVKNSGFVPVLFMADSIHDPQRIYLYPKGKLLILKEKFREEWIEIPIEEYSGTIKSQIFAGYIAKNSYIIFGTARAQTNTFLESYIGNTRNVYETWNEYVSRIEDFYVPAVKIELEK